MHACDYESPLGKMLLAADDGGLMGAWFYGQRYFARGMEGAEKDTETGEPADSPVLLAARCWLDAYFAGGRPSVADVPLAPRGTAFQRRVWGALLAIPYGETRAYGELAAELGSSPRAVGAAVGRNPISVIVPCHRVLGAGGSLTGYAGGLERKRALLELEQTASQNSIPRRR
ncbi:methylated-DNA--[protein]-cysteine S-methyltransferase [Thermophilibacter gallinarum]|nr:methylated-DNA--[protein]-cysteine S-methyltransferase [Thermophilibacter gallinarum]